MDTFLKVEITPKRRCLGNQRVNASIAYFRHPSRKDASSYLCDCLQLYTPSRALRSASDTLSLQIPRTRLSPHCWFPRFFCFRSICTIFPSLSDRNPLWTPSGLTLRHFCSQTYRPAMFSVPCCLLSSSVSNLCLLPILSCI